MMDTLLSDLRYALRQLARSPGFTTAAVLTLAIGIGANTAIYSIMGAVFSRPLPFADPDRIALIVKHFSPSDRGQLFVDPPSFVDWTADTSVFQAAALVAGGAMNLSTADEPERVEGNQITTRTFDLLGARPALGRSFLPEEAVRGKDHVVILSDALWRRRIAADAHVLGRTLLMDGAPYRIVGVMPPGFAFPDHAKFWVPLVFDSSAGRGSNWVNGIVRLRTGVTIAQADAHLALMSRRLAEQYPADNAGVSASLAPLRRLLVGDDVDNVRHILSNMLGAVGLVLLIACANLVNLLLARAATRRHEIGIRAALGASRGRLARQLLTESALLGVGGGALGLMVALWGVGLFRATVEAQGEIASWLQFSLDWRAVVFTVLVSLATGLLIGALPALRGAQPAVRGALQESSRVSGAHTGGSRVRSAFVVAEVALAVVLLVGAGLLIRTVVFLARVDPGFDVAHAFIARVPLGGTRFESARARGAFFDELARRVEALPGLVAAGAINIPPLGTVNWERARIEGLEDSSRITVINSVAGHYFRALGAPLRAGREFTEAEDERGDPVIIINETMARHYWPGESALGHRIRYVRDASERWLTIVGVARDIKQGSLGAVEQDQVYIPYGGRYSWSEMSFIARTAGDPLSVVRSVRAELREMDPTVPLIDVMPLQALVHRSYWNRQLYGTMFTLFAGIALLLAAIGVYGVMAYTVAQRTHEIGVRVALGAARRDVLRLVVRQGLGLTTAGLAVGVFAAAGVTRVLGSQLYGVSPFDPVSFALTALLLVAVALLASYLPARRAAAVDPMVALKYE
jgi:putative ABC transport system permease protein